MRTKTSVVNLNCTAQRARARSLFAEKVDRCHQLSRQTGSWHVRICDHSNFTDANSNNFQRSPPNFIPKTVSESLKDERGFYDLQLPEVATQMARCYQRDIYWTQQFLCCTGFKSTSTISSNCLLLSLHIIAGCGAVRCSEVYHCSLEARFAVFTGQSSRWTTQARPADFLMRYACC